MKILIWRNGKVGNTLAILPFLQTLKETYPDTPIDVVVDKLGAEILKYHPAINKLIVYDKRGKDKSIPATIRFVRSLRKQKYTHSIHLKRFFRNEFLSLLSGIPNRFGFKTNNKKGLLTATVDYSEEVNIIRTIYSIGKLFNFPEGEPPPYKYYTGSEDALEAEKILDELDLKTAPFVIIHCGGETSNDNKVPYTLYASLIIELHSRSLNPVLIDSPGDAESIEAVTKLLPDPSIVRVCKVNPIRTNAIILSKAALFIGNNSGQIHLAALYSIPSVLIYGSDISLANHEIKKWLPWQKHVKPYIVSQDKTETFMTTEIINTVRVLK